MRPIFFKESFFLKSAQRDGFHFYTDGTTKYIIIIQLRDKPTQKSSEIELLSSKLEVSLSIWDFS